MKKLTNKIFKVGTIVSIVLMLHSCIEDNINPPFTGELNSTAEMLVYFESLGDFPNSELAPAVVSAEEVYANISNYLIVDVRDNPDFITGHIEGAVNVQKDSLYDYIKNLNHNLYSKVVLISTNGHRSAYYACLLRLSGFNNIYTLNFGMASWNLAFADKWLNGVGNDSAIIFFNDEKYPKGEFTQLPSSQNQGLTIQERVETRIRFLLDIGFKKVEVYRSGFLLFGDDLMICYGNSSLYNLMGHAVGTQHYQDAPFYDMRAANYLQTLPTERAILIYSYNGQLSACMVAYLRVLGYDAISLEFGANQIFYSGMLYDPDLTEYAFDQSDIKNFPYVVDN